MEFYLKEIIVALNFIGGGIFIYLGCQFSRGFYFVGLLLILKTLYIYLH